MALRWLQALAVVLAALGGVTLARAADGLAAVPVWQIGDSYSPCPLGSPCLVPTGMYYAYPPRGWDRRKPLPTMFYLHGFRGSAEDEIGSADMMKLADDYGLLMVTLNGVNTGWTFPGTARQGRDDVAYVGSVLDDVEKRFPVDHARLWASGFSVGSSLVWYVACNIGQRFAAFGTIAGAFWDPMPTDCPAGPANIRHIHGLADRTVPLAGRSLRGGVMRQGNVPDGFATWKRINGCPVAPTRFEHTGALTCEIYDTCSSGKQLQFCLHAGEHEVWTEWLREDAAWVDDLARKAEAAKVAGAATPAR